MIKTFWRNDSRTNPGRKPVNGLRGRGIAPARSRECAEGRKRHRTQNRSGAAKIEDRAVIAGRTEEEEKNSMEYKIGIVEDDQRIAELLKAHLERYGFLVWVCESFSDVERQVLANNTKLLLLDINLPAYDGFFWCKKIRQHSTIPIIFLSARSMDLDQIYAMECGGDDYITKPFSYEIVTAKINACLRRAYGEYAAVQDVNCLEVNGTILRTESLKLEYGGQVKSLTKNETDILASLFQAYPKPVKRNTLLELLWDTDTFVEENTLNVNMGRARKRLKELGCPLGIKAIRNVGYGLEIREVDED